MWSLALKIIRVVLKHVRGAGAGTGVPTPQLLRWTDVGLLYFVNQKQAQLHHALQQANAVFEYEGVDETCGVVAEQLRTIASELAVVVGGVIVQAERIDEEVIATRKAMVTVGTDLYRCDLEIQQLATQEGGDIVTHTLQQFYKPRVTVSASSQARAARSYLLPKAAQPSSQSPSAVDRLVGLRHALETHKRNLRALTAVQKVFRGSGTLVTEAEAEGVVSELDLVTTARRAGHRIRDLVHDIPEPIPSVKAALEFLADVDAGLVGLVANLDHVLLTANRTLSLARKVSRLEELTLVDQRNKYLSAEAVRVVHAESSHAARAQPPPPRRAAVETTDRLWKPQSTNDGRVASYSAMSDVRPPDPPHYSLTTSYAYTPPMLAGASIRQTPDSNLGRASRLSPAASRPGGHGPRDLAPITARPSTPGSTAAPPSGGPMLLPRPLQNAAAPVTLDDFLDTYCA